MKSKKNESISDFIKKYVKRNKVDSWKIEFLTKEYPNPKIEDTNVILARYFGEKTIKDKI